MHTHGALLTPSPPVMGGLVSAEWNGVCNQQHNMPLCSAGAPLCETLVVLVAPSRPPNGECQ